MAWKKWIVRCVVYGIVAVCVTAGVLYQRWTNPAAVRQQVMSKLDRTFPGAVVSVDSARLRILGGIQLYGLRVCRRDDADRQEFMHVPSAVFYHDKEKILDGELTLRKVELYRPRLRVRRGANGNWNVQGLTGQIKPHLVIPTIVVHQGTIIFEDRLGDESTPPVEVNDIDLTLINDPLPTVTVRAGASSEAFGKLQLSGTLQRPTLDVAVNFQATHVPVNRQLLRRLTKDLPNNLATGLELEARTDLGGEVVYRPGQSAPLYYNLRAKLHKGRLAHPQLPLPLEELFASLTCSNGELRLEKLSAKSGPAEVEASGSASFPNPEKNFEGRLDVKHLTLCKELCDRLPEKLHKLHDTFQPAGPTTLHVDCARKDGVWTTRSDRTPTQVSLRPEGVSICFDKFAYPLARLTGSVDYNVLNRLVGVDLTGFAGERPVFIKGTWQGEGPSAEVRFDINATDIAIEEKLLGAMPAAMQKLARSFNARGRADVKAHVRHDAGAGEYRNEYHIRFHDTSACWDSFPCALEKITGVLDVYPDHWEFNEFKAAYHGGSVVINGRTTPVRSANGEKSQGLSVEIVGRGVPLDDELRKALQPMPNLQKAWDGFQPRGKLNFTAAIRRPTPDPDDLDVEVDLQGCAIRPQFFPMLMHDLGGEFHYRGNRVEISKVRGWHGESLLSLDRATIDLHPGGGYYADLADLQAQGFAADDEFTKALPKKLQDAVAALKLTEPVNARGRVIVSQPPEPGKPADIYWEDCQVWLRNAKLTVGVDLDNVTGTIACMGRYDGRQLLGLNGNLVLEQATAFKQPFRNAQANFLVRPTAPDVLLVGLRAPLFGGDVAGQVRVDFNSTLRYEANLTASQVDLAQFGRHNLGPKSDLSGMAIGRLHLTGLGTGIDTLDGNGSVDVPQGKLYNLPLLLDLLKFLGLHWPDRTAFEEAHALFSVRGKRVAFRRLDLFGNALSVSGKGEFNLDGTDLHGEFYTTSRVEQLLPPAVRPFPPAVSKNLLTIEVKGNMTANPERDLHFEKRWVPVLFDPLLTLQQRLSGEKSVVRGP